MKATIKNKVTNQYYLNKHIEACESPRGFESAILGLAKALEDYALTHRMEYGEVIGKDYYLGEAWANAVNAAQELLNGERGRLDGGLMSARFCNMLTENGFTDEGEAL